MPPFVLGIDFGTESGRVVLVDVQDGRVVTSHVTAYTHCVMESVFVDGSPLPDDWALQHPRDYLDVLRRSVPAVLADARIRGDDVIGIGVDFTSCTVLPVQEDGTPLCFLDTWKSHPHAYVKLWKHHAAEGYAEQMTKIARERSESFLGRYGGKISPEWLLPKVLEILVEAPEIYRAAARFVEAGDWIVWQLTGREVRNACAAGYKACWHPVYGYPSGDFMRSVHPGLANLIGTKIPEKVSNIGERAGYLTASWAKDLGLAPGTPVAVATIDAHASVPAVGARRPGEMVIVMGTSFCHMLLAEEEREIPGVAGVMEGGILPGWVGYEAGQPAVGDLFAWFLRNFVPSSLQQASEREGVSIHTWLMNQASRIPPGGSGLVALDWVNGNRSVLMDAALSGMFVGLTLDTSPEDIYRALLEGAAFGTRVIIEAFETHGVPVDMVYGCGGVAVKNPLFMQILADVTGKEIYVSDLVHASAVGAAMLAAVAAGPEKGGYETLEDAIVRMSRKPTTVFRPSVQARQVYEELYSEYRRLHDYFGRENEVMKNLRRIRLQARAASAESRCS